MARVQDIRFVGYGVKDLEAETRFYIDAWKLVEVPSDDGLVYLAAPGSDVEYSVRLRQTDEPRIDVVSWAAADPAEVDALFEQVKAAGGKPLGEPGPLVARGGGYGFRFFDVSGFTIEVATGFERRVPEQLAPGEPRPEKISHVVFHAPNHKAWVKFYEEALGFKVSDWLGDFMCFLRCNEWHHRLAVVPGPPTFNHIAYDVPGVDAVMKGLKRLRSFERDTVWGVGRHTAGNNLFSYYITPGGWAVEYTSDLEKVDEATWEPKVHQPSLETMDQWGTGVGGPKTMPEPRPDSGLFQAPEV
jgi:catechol 2,3-dioxygenase-like lactoylglutathione lyase family enzyme